MRYEEMQTLSELHADFEPNAMLNVSSRTYVLTWTCSTVTV